MEREGVNKGPVGGPLGEGGVSGGDADEWGDDGAAGPASLHGRFGDEEVGEVTRVVEETIRGAVANPCPRRQWYSCWLLAFLIRW